MRRRLREPILKPGGGVTLFILTVTIAFGLWFPGVIGPIVHEALSPVFALFGLSPQPSTHSSEH